MREQMREPRTYELMTILSPEVPEEEITGQLERISGYVTAAGGAIQDTRRDSPWGRRRLAYPIRHSGRDLRDGFYTLFHIELPPNRVDDVERELKLNPQLMRYLITHYAPQPLDPRAVEEAEIAAEDAAADAYAAAQAEAARLAAAGTAEAAPAPEPEPAPTAAAEATEPAVGEPATAEAGVAEPAAVEAEAPEPTVEESQDGEPAAETAGEPDTTTPVDADAPEEER